MRLKKFLKTNLDPLDGSTVDWSRSLPLPPPSRKGRLIEKCNRHDVAIHVDDVAETTSGVYSAMRAVASEAELERRLVAKLAIRKSILANRIAALSLVTSLLSLIYAIYFK